jgi:putative addiction module CopG family antidote
MGQEKFSLSATDQAFVARQVADGAYARPEDVILAALRLLEHEQQNLKALRDAISEGDADFTTGRYRAYAPGKLAAEIMALRETPRQRKSRGDL